MVQKNMTNELPSIEKKMSLNEFIQNHREPLMKRSERARLILDTSIANGKIEFSGRRTDHYGIALPTNTPGMFDIHGYYVASDDIYVEDENGKPVKMEAGMFVALSGLHEMTGGTRPSPMIRCGCAMVVARVPKTIVTSMITNRQAKRARNWNGNGQGQGQASVETEQPVF